MTVIRPNSVSGITSITAQANEINFFRSNGALAGLQLNGVNFNTTTGVSTFNNLDVGGVLTYQDVTNVDSIGIITARSTIDAQGDVSIADKIIHTGDTNTAIRFPAADTITAETGGSSRFKIDSSGNVTIGNDGDSGSNPSAGYDELCIEGGNENIGMCFLSPAANNVEQTISFGDSNNNQSGKIQYEHANDAMHFDTAGSERLRIDSGGRMGLGTNSPSSYNNKAYNFVIASSSHAGMTIAGGTTSDSSIYFADGTSGAAQYAGWVQYEHDNNALTFGVNTSERLRITSTGQLLVGTTSASNRFKNGNGNGATPKFQFETANVDEQNDISLTFGRNNSFGAEIILAKHRAATVGGHTIVQSGDRLGGINFAGSDGTHFRPAALIQGRVDGTPGTGDMPGRLEFHTTADGAATPTERLRITSAGSVLSSTSFVSKATADVNVTISTASGFTANTFVTVINHGVLEEESVYIISFKWNHGSSGQQPYFSHGAFVFNPSEVNTGSTGGQGPNYAPFQGHHMHTGVNRYWSFRYYGATGGTSVHGLQAAFDQTLNQSSGTLEIRATKIAKVTTI